MATLRLPSGFGEIAIIFQKLSTASSMARYKGLHFDVELCADQPRGCEEFVTLLRDVKLTGLGKHTTADCLSKQIPWHDDLADHLHAPIYPTVDHHLINGRFITSWLPELNTDYHYPISLPESSRLFATRVTQKKPYGVIYPSCIDRMHMLGGWGDVWNPEQWAAFIKGVTSRTNFPWFVVGSGTDAPMLNYLTTNRAIPADRVFRPASLCDTLALIDGATYFVGFPAGPAVVAGILNVPHCVPFRWPVQRLHRGSYTDPAMLLDGRAYLPWFTDPPALVAEEVALKAKAIRQATVSGARYVPDSLVPGPGVLSKPAAAEPDLWKTLQPLSTPFKLVNVGLIASANSRDCFEAKVHEDDHYRWLYALGRHYTPRQILDLGTGYGHAICSLLTGVLDAGIPPSNVGLCDLRSLDYALAMVRAIGARSSWQPDVCGVVGPSQGDKAREQLGISGYTMVHVDASRGAAECLEDLRWGFKCLSAPGTLVVTGTKLAGTGDAFKRFCAEVGVPRSELPTCCGIGIIRKLTA